MGYHLVNRTDLVDVLLTHEVSDPPCCCLVLKIGPVQVVDLIYDNTTSMQVGTQHCECKFFLFFTVANSDPHSEALKGVTVSQVLFGISAVDSDIYHMVPREGGAVT